MASHRVFETIADANVAAAADLAGPGGPTTPDLWTTESPTIVHYYAQVYENGANTNFFAAESPTAITF